MARRKESNPILDLIASVFPAKMIRARARETGAVCRERKIDIVDFVWTLILGFSVGTERTLASLRRTFERTTGTHIVPSAFYDRFNAGLARLLKGLVEQVLERLVPAAGLLDGTLQAFRDVLITDSTVIRLHDLLQKSFAACRTNHTKAAAKLHAVMNVTGRGLNRIKLTAERVHDGPVLRAGRWVKGCLLLFDLGYYRFQLFDCIRRQGGYFVSRLKDNTNPVIVAAHRTWRGRAVPLVGCRLQDVLGRLLRESLDVEVELRVQRRSYRGRRTRAIVRFRLVAVRNPVMNRYHLYITNVPTETLSAEEIASVYGARWAVELLFRELKRTYRLAQLPSSKRVVVESLIYATLLTLAVSRSLQRALQQRMTRALARRVRDERWAAVFSNAAENLLAIIVGPCASRRRRARRLYRFLRHEAVDPNAGRLLLLERVERGIGHATLAEAA